MSRRFVRKPAHLYLALLSVATLACGVATASPSWAAVPLRTGEEIDAQSPMEFPDDPPGIPAQAAPGARRAPPIVFGRFTSVQVNVNGAGANIPGDAANEPSIAVDPTNHNRIAIGWRQFDTIASNFREAGFGYSSDGGLTWTMGEIESGVFRSDPVLAFDAQGKFFYNSLSVPGPINIQVFPSTDGGMSWGSSVFGFGGDKQWMTIDRTGGIGHDFHYQAWSTAGNSYAPNTFNRSADAGASYESPSFITDSPIWGTLDVGPDGTLYVVGSHGPSSGLFVARSTNAEDSGTIPPTFTTVPANIGGTVRSGGTPNPGGLVGQAWIAVDRSNGPRDGWIYVLSSVQTVTDPLDVYFIRSSDGGQTWSTPVRVNDDTPGNGAWQWFGTMSVSPDGRIDAVWNDTRGQASHNLCALHYTFSTDGGTTWAPNEQASPVWNSIIGWPNQNKIGDYYHMISDNQGADLAWAATFTGGEDIYYTRIANSTTAVDTEASRGIRLHPNLPNPFTSSTTIRFDMPAAGGRAKLEVFDASGRRVASLVDGPVSGGTQSARWNGTDEAGQAAKSGIYLCRLEVLGIAQTRKLMLLR